jgi:hypothetical protein
LRKGLFLVLVLVLDIPSVKTGREGSSSERLAGREFILRVTAEIECEDEQEHEHERTTRFATGAG